MRLWLHRVTVSDSLKDAMAVCGGPGREEMLRDQKGAGRDTFKALSVRDRQLQLWVLTARKIAVARRLIR